ncbi:MAG: 2,3-bisphosphoglycerate-independent phosphoglycerate mutase [Gammaproteobacteria bacterium]
MAIKHRPMILIVLDGWGHSDSTQYNAIHSAHKPVWDDLWALYPHMLLRCSGVDVGLPDGQMGNSEVGHMHLGAGRIIDQEFTRISRSIEDESFFENPTLIRAFGNAKQRGAAVHLMGLLSPGGVHSHEDHIFAMFDLAAHCKVGPVFLHAFLDGRDTPPKSAAESILKAHTKFLQRGGGRLASLVGRYYAMDRNQNWTRTEAAYRLLREGQAPYQCSDPFIALDLAYERGESDEFIQPTAITRGGSNVQMKDGDVVVFMNYRADRARQLTRAFTEPSFSYFPRHPLQLGAFITLTSYSADFDLPVVFPPERLNNVFGEYIAAKGLHQLRIAETEKYAHVTYFFNGGEERVFEGEDRVLVPSPHVATYDHKPEMSVNAVTDRIVEAIHSLKYDVIISNFANPDMVGHSGNFAATVKAIEAVDPCLGRILAAAQAVGGEIVITADHGNAERMRSAETKTERGQPHTAHTTNPVPFIYIGRAAEAGNTGSLIDIAPTLLYLMGIEPPSEMTGRSLITLERQTDQSYYRLRPQRRISRLM